MADDNLKLIEEIIIPKASSKAFILKKDQVLRVIAHEGPQVADIRFFNANDYNEQVSTTWSVALNSLEGIGGEKKLKKLWSKPGYENHMLSVIHDPAKQHFFHGNCSPRIREMWDNGPLLDEVGPLLADEHLTCAEQFDNCLEPYGLSMKDLDSAGVFNLFMAVNRADDEVGTLIFEEPTGAQGDYVDFLAHMDILVASVSCADLGPVNGGEPKGMKYQIYDGT